MSVFFIYEQGLNKSPKCVIRQRTVLAHLIRIPGYPYVSIRCGDNVETNNKPITKGMIVVL
jgi:hypothetical protein